jgi:hypothetical protein
MAIANTSSTTTVKNVRLKLNEVIGKVNTLGNTFVTSTVTNITAGDSLSVVLTANNQFPGGVFTIQKLGAETSTFTNAWGSGGTSKNQYTDYANSTVNTQNIVFTISLTNATFNIQSADYISIAGVTILTGATLAALGISGTGGTYTLSSANFSSAIQIRSSTAITYSLTTSRSVRTGSGTTLTGTAPTVYNVSSVTANWATNPVKFWLTNQAFNWSLGVTGTTAAGTTSYTGGASGTLTSSGATSGSSSSLDSTLSYTISTSGYSGTGLNGAGTATSANRSTTRAAATVYYPLFWKTNQSSSNPTFTTSDSHNAFAFATGQTVVTTATPADYTWIATPTSAARTFKYIFLGSDVVLTPTVSYTSQTISGTTYNVYGFTNFSAVTTIYVVT